MRVGIPRASGLVARCSPAPVTGRGGRLPPAGGGDPGAVLSSWGGDDGEAESGRGEKCCVNHLEAVYYSLDLYRGRFRAAIRLIRGLSTCVGSFLTVGDRPA